MKRIYAMVAMAAVAAMAITGCEWSTHDEDVQSYNDTGWQWVNFSGSYQKYATDPVYHNVNNKDIPDESQLSADLVVSTATGPGIRVLTVAQKGQRLTITDNVGGTYKGTISDMRSAMGKMNYNDMNRVGATNAIQLANGDVVVATFSASGRSGAGLQVTLTGTFQGEIINNGQAFAKRTISGTWIETGGVGASIYGAAEPIVRYGYNGSSGAPLETTLTKTDSDSDSGDSGDSGGDSGETTLTVEPKSATISATSPKTITASGGNGVYDWAFAEGDEFATFEVTDTVRVDGLPRQKTVKVTWVAAGDAVLVVTSGKGTRKIPIHCEAGSDEG